MTLPEPYYNQDGIVLYHGDCREILPQLTEKVDLVLTDPPYGTHDLGGGYGRRQLWDSGNGEGRSIVNDHDLTMLEAIRDCLPVDCGWAMVFYAARRTPSFVDVMRGWDWFGEVIWDKAQPGLGYHIRYCHESIAVFRVGTPPRPPNPLMSVIRYPSISLLHPHEKPEPLLAKLITWGSMDKGTVLDPFLGSGTTAVAAKKLGRRCIGIRNRQAAL